MHRTGQILGRMVTGGIRKNTRLAAAVWILTLCLGFAPAGGRAEESLARFEFSKPQMGIPCRIVLYAPDRTRARTAVEAAFARMETLNRILSDYEYDSELSRLSRSSGQGAPVRVSPELWRVLEHSQELSRLSHGAFDITLGPATSLWRKARRDREFPAARHLAMVRERSDPAGLVLDRESRSAELKAPHMRLDLGGIAKGYALDEAMQVLKQSGISSALINAGGDLLVAGTPPGHPGWRVGIPGLEENASERAIELRDQALATSGDLYQFVELDGIRYSHIVDPRTCLGLTNRCQVRVVADRGMIADGLATTLNVMGMDGLKLLARFPGTSAQLLLPLNGEQQEIFTAGFPQTIPTAKKPEGVSEGKRLPVDE